ncbi:MAG TPA: DNA recombination protein RmuC, partial [Polyangia bacterium]|nr:DNA recombination protein RmuC [Polyangia bacterium]
AQTKAIEGMVGPVRASLEKFDEQIRAMERERGTAYGELRQQMIGISATQDKLRDATGSLVAALKAPAVRGRWGEMQLRRVVELAGMLEHCDFDEQTTIAGVDGRLRPDMIIHLPGGRRIVVDAKAPLGAYLEAREAASDEVRAAKYRQHAAQVRAHMQKLGAKSYWDALDAAPDMVVMFLPGEPLYSVALEQMPELMEEGQAQRVMVATPMTLIALLRTASFGWREERLAENAQRISDEGRRLHERIATVMDHFADLGNALNQSVKHFNKSLRSFEQRVVVSARRLEELDARGKKEVAPLEEVDARAVGPDLPERQKSERSRRLTQQPLLTLAPPPDQEG